jgi:hypothetical protein
VSELIVAVAGVVVLTGAIIALIYVTEARMRFIASEQQRIHLQQANIIAMLLRAGFRGPREGLDWGDSGSWTRVRHGSDSERSG